MSAAETMLAELVEECVRASAALWETTQRAHRLVRAIERTKRHCAGTPEEKDRLIARLTDDAWRRVVAARATEEARP
jgi:hypothetical protein